MGQLRFNECEDHEKDSKAREEITVDLIPAVAGIADPGLSSPPQSPNQPWQFDRPRKKTDKDGHKIKRQKEQVHPEGIRAVTFHGRKRPTNNMPADSNRKELAVRLNQCRNSPKRDHGERE